MVSKEEQEAAIDRLTKRVDRCGQAQTNRKSRHLRKILDELNSVWEELKDLNIYRSHALHKRVEDLQIEILRQVARLSDEDFSRFIGEIRERGISMYAEIALLVIRSRSARSRWSARSVRFLNKWASRVGPEPN